MKLKRLNNFDKVKVKINTSIFDLQICDDHQTGLSGINSLIGSDGMIFFFDKSRHLSFHMKGCLFNLDLLFINNFKIEKIYHSAPPCVEQHCVKYRHHGNCVIELRGGTAKKFLLTEGLKITIIQ